jgi:tetratricopeptide (TPR) repeat protein
VFCNRLNQQRRRVSKRIGLLGGIVLAAVFMCYAVAAADDLSDIERMDKEGFVHFKAGKAAAGEKKYDQAVQEFTQAIDNWEKADELCDEVLCRYEEGWEFFSVLDSLAEAYALRAGVFGMLKDLDRAERDAKSSIACNEYYALPHAILASIYIMRGEEKLARSEYRVLKDDLGMHDAAERVLQAINEKFPPSEKTK